jgi:PAS domain S-box-containing protein
MDLPLPPLRVLLIEDSTEDAALALRTLRGLGRPVVSETVADEASLREALPRFSPDIVLSDFSMPGFSGQDALRVVQDFDPEIPFIFVSGTIGEEVAIEAMQRGAADYVLKDNLRRLLPAVERALRSSAERAERVRMQRALRASEERFRSIVENTDDWIWEVDHRLRHTYCNRSVEAMLGYAPDEMLGRSTLDWMPPHQRDRMLAELPLLARGEGWHGRVGEWRHRDGSARHLESNGHPLRDERGALLGFRGISRDVTLRLAQEAKIAQLARIQGVLGALGNAVLRADDLDELLDAACRLAVEQGQFRGACIGTRDEQGRVVLRHYFGDPGILAYIHSLGPLSDAEGSEDRTRPAVRAMREGRLVAIADVAADTQLPRALRHEMRRLGVAAQVALPIGGDAPWGVLGLFSSKKQVFDADEIGLLERLTAEIDYARDFIAKSERLEYLAHHNPVTGLPNRAAFQDRLAARMDQGPMLVGLLDFVRFHYVSDSRGRAFADKLLAAVGNRLAARLGTHSLLAHPSGNTYLIALPARNGLAEASDAVDTALAECAGGAFTIDGEHIHIALRGGVALAPEHGRDLDTLERHALAALTEATKRDLPLVAYSEELHTRAERRILLDRELREALAEEQFEIFLQPKFDARTRRLTGAEALLRWRHPERGLVPPAEFVPILEETGLITQAGHWVMVTALRVLRRWRREGREGPRMAINVSSRELRQEGFIDRCTELLDAGRDDHGLDIEVTESLLMDDIQQNIRVLDTLRNLGCQIAIDDFGTGYSSLNYLARLPADVLKVDQSFTAQISSSPEMLALVTNIIGLAHSLNLKVVAEGVEGEEQEKLLRLLRCDELQGYLFGRPLPVAEFEKKFLAN